jgi:dihydrofolate reductase
VITLVLAVSDNGVIGARGGIPWRIPQDMKRFKALTMGKPIVMGRKTWESFPTQPLPGRVNIVVTRDRNYKAPGALIAHSVDAALRLAEVEQTSDTAVIGGVEIYLAALPHATRIELTEVHSVVDGDAWMPQFDPAVWREVAREEHSTAGGLRYSFVTLDRIRDGVR